ncbi:MAG TPA: hypothetical protein VJ225_02095 [Nitrososphaeraceae archaeon]|nr:hypothetical protein [Nitrososphaeraceae archaeon]
MSTLMIKSLLLLSSFILATILLFISISCNNLNLIYAQFQNNNNTLLGVNITSPAKGQQIPVGSNLTVSGKSTDNSTTDDHDCEVSVIVNSIKPYQPATENGTIGEGNNDYSRWYFVLGSNYTSIKEGVNEITAKLSCLSSLSNNNNNLTKWYSVNVTRIPTADNITISPKSSYVISPSITAKADNNNEPQSSETNDNEVQKTIIDNNNDDIGDKIREKLKNLREKINERVKETLEQQGIESDLPSSPN